MQWERLKRAGLAPSKRASYGMVTHRDRALLFGGVTDRAGAGADETAHELVQYTHPSVQVYPFCAGVKVMSGRQVKASGMLAVHPVSTIRGFAGGIMWACLISLAGFWGICGRR